MARIRHNTAKVLKKHYNQYSCVRVELTRETTEVGQIVYSVLITNMNTGRNYRVWTYTGIQKAFNRYKRAIA